MKTYKFIFIADPSSVALSHPFKGEIGEYKITIPEKDGDTIISVVDLKNKFDDLICHIGLKISVFVNSRNIDDGVYKAKIRAKHMAVVFSFICNTTISDPILQIGYETTESAVKTEFIQFLYMNGELIKQKTVMNPILFDNLVELIMKDHSPRIARAIRWYEVGLNEKDSIDKFIYYWMGMECLNGLLAKELDAKPKTGECKNCGYSYVISTVNGIEMLFEKYSENGKSDYKNCKNMRNKLQHGYGDLIDLVEVSNEYAEICRKKLLQGLYLLLKVEQHIIDIHPEPIYNLNIPYMEFKGYYEIPPRDLSTDPFLIIDNSDIKINIVNNAVALDFVNNIDTNIPINMKLEEVTFVGEQGTRMEIKKTELIPKT